MPRTLNGPEPKIQENNLTRSVNKSLTTNWASLCLYPTGERNFSFPPFIHTESGAHQTSYKINTTVLVPGDKTMGAWNSTLAYISFLGLEWVKHNLHSPMRLYFLITLYFSEEPRFFEVRICSNFWFFWDAFLTDLFEAIIFLDSWYRNVCACVCSVSGILQMILDAWRQLDSVDCSVVQDTDQSCTYVYVASISSEFCRVEGIKWA